LAAGFSIPASAQVPAIDYVGFGWESSSLPPSVAGDELVFVGVADDIDPLFGVDLGAVELTFHVYDLISTGEVDIGGGNSMISYTGGTLDIYKHDAMDADWGVFPPNATAPSTFANGDLFFCGAFSSFTIFFTATGAGSFEGLLDGVAGELIGDVCNDCAYTWGGIFTAGTGAQIPDGYDFQLDGVFEVDPAISNVDATWSGVKRLYR
jgi:hypothetical protein